MKTMTLLIALLILPLSSLAQNNTEMSEQQKYTQWASQLWGSIEQQVGKIEIEKAGVTLNVNDDFYYLSASDAEKVLVDVWGNPPGQNTLGLLMPANVTAFDAHAWAVTIQYEEDGYVSDENADEIDYIELLSQMKEDSIIASEERVKNGYDPIRLIGWASPPYYDSASHKLHWAKELKVGNYEQNTLNYNIRVLGRKGVLVLNFIAGMDQKALIDESIDEVLAIAEFNEGAKYGNFNPDMDDVATYGIGALITGKIIAKTGVLATALIFLKKFAIIFIVGMVAFLKKTFRKKSSEIKNS